jgi:hypothetical protein
MFSPESRLYREARRQYRRDMSAYRREARATRRQARQQDRTIVNYGFAQEEERRTGSYMLWPGDRVDVSVGTTTHAPVPIGNIQLPESVQVQHYRPLTERPHEAQWRLHGPERGVAQQELFEREYRRDWEAGKAEKKRLRERAALVGGYFGEDASLPVEQPTPIHGTPVHWKDQRLRYYSSGPLVQEDAALAQDFVPYLVDVLQKAGIEPEDVSEILFTTAVIPPKPEKPVRPPKSAESLGRLSEKRSNLVKKLREYGIEFAFTKESPHDDFWQTVHSVNENRKQKPKTTNNVRLIPTRKAQEYALQHGLLQEQQRDVPDQEPALATVIELFPRVQQEDIDDRTTTATEVTFVGDHGEQELLFEERDTLREDSYEDRDR